MTEFFWCFIFELFRIYRSVGMGENSVTISPSITGAGSAVLGLGAGYILAPEKYTLDRLLMQDNDSFERHFSSSVMQNSTEGEKKSLQNLNDAALIYRSSGDEILKEKIIPNAKLWREMVEKVNVEDKFVSEVNFAKQKYLKALEDTDFMNLKKALEDAQEQLCKKPNDTKAHLELKAASRNFANAQLAVDHPLSLYKKARVAFRNARDEAIQGLPDKGRAISAQWDKVRRAISDRANIMYEKLASLSKNEALNNDYRLIKKYIPKSRTYSSLMGGILAGILGLIAGVYSLNKANAA